jgi:hypothetical protein
MTLDRFNQLLQGPLDHPLLPFKCTRILRALWHVVERTGEPGRQALEEFCEQQDELDRIKSGELPAERSTL